jgi:tRNA 2-thiouridine synthesizing protein D
MAAFSLAIYSAPYSSEASYTALRFAQALLSQGHQLLRVFFYQDGVHNSNTLTCPPQDEINLTTAWQDLAKEHQIDLVVCIAAALRRGILNQEESERYNKSAYNLLDGFQISGLGQLLDAAVNSDRLISFGH